MIEGTEKPRRLHRALNLQHHRHTAKKLEHHHTSYRAIFVVLAVCALAMGTIQRAGALNLQVKAVVPSSVLTEAAQITSPHSGDTTATPQVTVSGSCQVVINGTIVVIERAGVVVGSTACQQDGTFSLGITLLDGPNTLLPRVYDTANQYGPDGDSVTVFYIKPTPPTSEPPVIPSGSQSGSGTVTGPIIMAVKVPFVLFTPGKAASLPFGLTGGTAPYVVVLNWGDNTEDETFSFAGAGDYAKNHLYKKANVYTIKISVTDATGQEFSMELVSVGMQAPTVGVTSPTGTGGPLDSARIAQAFDSGVVKGVWFGYAIACLLTVVLWIQHPALLFDRWSHILVKRVRRLF